MLTQCKQGGESIASAKKGEKTALDALLSAKGARVYAGAEANGLSGKAIVWGRKRTDRSLFVPLPREAWISGKSYPTATGNC